MRILNLLDLGIFPALNYLSPVGRRGTVAVCALVACLAVGAGTSMAGSSPPNGRFAAFLTCMKEHGAPAVKPHTKLTADQWAALKKAFAACRDQLPKMPSRGGRATHKFTPPTAAQVASFKACMADKGFPLLKPSAGKGPNLHDPNVRKALWAALKTCLPLLKPAASSG